MVFVGYGLVVPEMKYDDLAGLDLRGKIAVYSGWRPRLDPRSAEVALPIGCRASQVMEERGRGGHGRPDQPTHRDVPWSRTSAARLHPAMSLSDDATPRLTVTVNPAHADKFLAGSGHRFEELLALADAGKPLPTFPIPAALEGRVQVAAKDVESQNVVGDFPARTG